METKIVFVTDTVVDVITRVNIGSLHKAIEATKNLSVNRSKTKPRKLNLDQELQIKELYSSGDYHMSTLAQMFGVSQPTISRIVNRQQNTQITV